MAPLFADEKGATIAFSRWGKGGVLSLCDPWSLSNEGIKSGDNLIVVLNALNHRDAARKPAVTFDEYHHGYGTESGITALLGLPAKLGLLQMAVAFLLLALTVSRRFGRPVPLDEGERHRSEYLASMSSLLRKARATDLVRIELGRHFVREAASALGMPSNAPPEAIIQAAEKKRPDQVKELHRLMVAATATSFERVDNESSLLTLAGQWHQMRKELKKIK